MKLLPVSLVAKRGNWQRFKARQRKRKFIAIADQVLARDNYTCRFCGFMSHKYQEIVNINHNYLRGQSNMKNLATACQFCSQCFFLDGIGTDNKSGGTIIYLPEFSQADLNHFCRALFTSMLQDAPYKGKLQTAYLSLKDRCKTVDNIFGPQSSDPFTFGQAIIDCNFSDDELNHPVMKNLRLLPNKKYFEEQVKYWKATVFDQVPL